MRMVIPITHYACNTKKFICKILWLTYRHDFGFISSTTRIPPQSTNKYKIMRSLILTACSWMLAIAGNAQGASRVPSGTPIRWGMNGSIEVMEGDLARHYGSTDTAAAFRRTPTPASIAIGGNPNATRFSSVQALCTNNTMQLNWVAVQQSGADRYEIEQSANGRNWTVIGVVLANRTDFGEASYSFSYNKSVSNVWYRIVATSTGGERLASGTFGSPCSNNSYLGADPNPVYSTTTVRIGSPGTARANMLLLDAKGTVMSSSDVSLVAGINHLPLNMSNLPAGYYTLVIRWTNGRQETLKLVKQ